MLNKMLYFVLAMAAVMLIGCSKQAPEINITDNWVRATAEGQEVGAAYMTITSVTDNSLMPEDGGASSCRPGRA